jgi:von Willebrand factor type A domain
MKLSRIISLGLAWTAFFLGPTTKATAQVGTDHFTINIPKKTTSPFVPIGEVKAVVSLSNDSLVTFTFTDERLQTRTIGPISPGTGLTTPSVTFPPEDSSALGGDTITITTSSSSASDSTQYRYEIDIQLKSNFDSNCVNKQIVDPNFYKVQISSTAATPPAITAVCLESFDGHPRPTGLNSCTDIGSNPNYAKYEVPIPPDTPPETSADEVAAATLDPFVPMAGVAFPQPALACYQARPSVSVVMVLDKSGSMSTIDAGSTFPGTRMDALHTAVGDFLDDWAALPPLANDQVGVVTFDNTATQIAPMESLSPTHVTHVKNAINATGPGGSTSIGEGLVKGANLLFPATGRRVFLLMSDGIQNTDRMVSAVGAQVVTDCQADPTPCGGVLNSLVPLPVQAPIYPLTIGPTVSAATNYAVAKASGGFYLNAESNTTQMLHAFFVELLQNFLRFNSYETVRLISESVASTAPYSATFPISTTSHDAVFSLMWPSQLGSLRLTVAPPGGAPPIVRESASGFISLVQTLPLSAPFDPRGDWKILVEVLNAAGIAAVGPAGGAVVPFDLHLMTDDAGIKTDLAVVPGDYTPGNSIRLRAKVANFGLPILGLGSHPGDQVKVDLIKPGQSIGDMLSDSTASSTSSGPDPDSPAEAKLSNTLQKDPSALKQVSDTAQLFDDGKPEHGDDVAGDGIYSALYPGTLPGHYNFLFSIESTDPNSIRFSRQQLRTAYVRSVPDAGNTVFQTSILRGDKNNVLSMVMTPRVKPGPGCLIDNPKCGRMGPGWANYFWFSAPGQTPFKSKDNLDGTYTATLSFVGSTPPPVSVHFENVLAVIGDSVPPDKLPDPLGQGNVLTLVPGPNGPSGDFAVFLDAGGNIPQGAFGSTFDKGFSLNGGLEYIATNHFSVDGIFGYHHFPTKIGASLNVYQFSVDGKTYLTGGTIRPFVSGGIGGYAFNPGSTYFGGNVGGGILFTLTPRFGLQGSYNFHVANTTGTATKWSTAQAGLRFVF